MLGIFYGILKEAIDPAEAEDVGGNVTKGEQSQSHVGGNPYEEPLAERSEGDAKEERAAFIAARVKRLCQDAVESGGEGLMVKALTGDNGTYCPAKRSENAWIKLKKDYLVAEGCVNRLLHPSVGPRPLLVG